MFRRIANRVVGTRAFQADTVFQLESRTIATLLDRAWELGGRGVSGAPGTLRTAARRSAVGNPLIAWDHLIYAYMIENSRAYEIFRRVVWELLHGERLGLPLTPTTHQWLRTTEALFLTDWPPAPLDLVSRARPDLAASRRNAYYRMFGMDLNHGADGGRTYPYEKPPVANRDFVATIEELLHLVWRAIENATNTSGPRETDPDAIADSALRLQNMLNARRGGDPTGLSLARDEFVHVSTLNWFHLTVEANTAVVLDLRAGGPSEEERLRLIGERVGVPAHGRSHSYFQIARPISIFLTAIELGAFSTATGAQSLYLPTTGNSFRDDVLRVINHWSMISGRDMKARAITVSGRAQIPVTATTSVPAQSDGRGVAAAGAAISSPPSGNGRQAADVAPSGG
jgi:hypothetical protein